MILTQLIKIRYQSYTIGWGILIWKDLPVILSITEKTKWQMVTQSRHSIQNCVFSTALMISINYILLGSKFSYHYHYGTSFTKLRKTWCHLASFLCHNVWMITCLRKVLVKKDRRLNEWQPQYSLIKHPLKSVKKHKHNLKHFKVVQRNKLDRNDLKWNNFLILFKHLIINTWTYSKLWHLKKTSQAVNMQWVTWWSWRMFPNFLQ